MDLLNSMNYAVINGRLKCSRKKESQYDKILNFWQNYWHQELGIVLNPDVFHRQDKITYLEREDEVIGMHFYSYYNLHSDFYEDYFKNYPLSNLSKLLANKVQSIQTMEYLMVSPDWSLKKSGLAIAPILVSLGMKHHELEECEASITIARSDIGAISLAKKCQYTEFGDRFTLHGNPVASMICKDPRVYPNKKIEDQVQTIWGNYLSKIATKEVA